MTESEAEIKAREDKLTEAYRLEDRRGGKESPRPGDTRRPYDRDYSRVLHSPSFRRLQSKTQVLGIGHGDFYRTRLTHSLEAAQIARGIAHHLRNTRKELYYCLPPRSLVEASALAHDLGHPPFGHFGEKQLNLLMRDHGGFEGNGQTLRILTHLESGAPSHGLNLTRRLLLAVLKYPVALSNERQPKVEPESHARYGLKPPKGYLETEHDLVEWLLEPFTGSEKKWLSELDVPEKANDLPKPKNKTLDCTIMELADDIAYGVHDLEDAMRLRLVRQEDLDDPEYELDGLLTDALTDGDIEAPRILEDLAASDSRARKTSVGELVNLFVTTVQLAENDAAGYYGAR